MQTVRPPGIDECKLSVVLVGSRASFRSEYVNPEWRRALDQKNMRNKLAITLMIGSLLSVFAH